MAPNVKEERKYEQPQKQAKRKLQIKGRGLTRILGQPNQDKDTLIKSLKSVKNHLKPI